MGDVEVLFHRLAVREYRAAEAWYARRSPGAARRFEELPFAQQHRLTSRQLQTSSSSGGRVSPNNLERPPENCPETHTEK